MTKNRNELNELSTSEWVQFTRSFWETNYPLDATWIERRACKTTKQPQVMRDIVKFFTQGGETVLDPFANVGSTLIGASMCGRNSVGIEKDERYCRIYHEIQNKYGIYHGQIVLREEASVSNKLLQNAQLVNEDSKRYLEAIKHGYADFVLTSPPFGPHDIGELDDFIKDFIRVARQVYRVLEEGRYFVFFMGDRFTNGEYVPLSHILTEEVKKVGFKLKGIKIWVNKGKPVNTKTYRVGQVFVPNIEHENIIIMCK